jgi:hypothetical protein
MDPQNWVPTVLTVISSFPPSLSLSFYYNSMKRPLPTVKHLYMYLLTDSGLSPSLLIPLVGVFICEREGGEDLSSGDPPLQNLN